MAHNKDHVLQKSIQNAWLTILSSIAVRIFTFGINAYVLRHQRSEILGLGVRLLLLFDTLLFLSREAFRKACLTRPKNGHWRGIINLTWLSVPLGCILSLVLGYTWIYVLELPQWALVNSYVKCVYLTCASVIITLCSEPFFIVGQAYMHIKFRSAVDLFWGCATPFVQGLVITFISKDEDRLLWIGLASILVSSVFLASHLVYFSYVIQQDDGDEMPFRSMREFLPDVSRFNVDHSRLTLSSSFFKQGFFKQFLTEGEKYVFTWFSLMTLSEQGIYDVIANLGSIPARLFFVKLEESAHLYFSQTVSRKLKAEMPQEEAPSRHLNLLLKGLILLGMVIVTFGMSYSHLLLHLYGGTLLSDGLGPILLRSHCFYIIFLALNGISECYAFNVMSAESVSTYNYWMAVMSVIFLSCAWGFANMFGPVGFILANMCNLSMRIVHNFRVIHRRHVGTKVNPLKDLVPKGKVLLTLFASGAICQISEHFIYKPTVKESVIHLTVGIMLFFLTLFVIVMSDKDWRALIQAKLIKKDQ
ncbi:hypothetical protein TCAL_07150 [Tigriopus californicus]|uniref:Protein RFT1 homolog n=1 Tax=Tigriopus californicus TaxID=6832 RepID=A0A553NEW0_TIGCA|nr:protein RFT1 homolog [Tigriopus californicus]TRY63982.1 hypothetical protein TCAL_07150 [Tigriopus californicus]